MVPYELELKTAIRAVREAALLTRKIAEGITPEVLEKRTRAR